MDKIGKLDRILDEEDGDVVANEIEIALVGVEFDRKATNIARQVSGARAAGDGGERREDFRDLAFSARNEARVTCGIGLVTSK